MTKEDRYALFLFECHDSYGGVGDLVFIGALEDCKVRAEGSSHELQSQIADMVSLKIHWTGEWGYTRSPLVGHPITWHYEWTEATN